MKVTEFDYDLPKDRIAAHPLKNRDQSRLMVLRRESGLISHHVFKEFPDLLESSDLVVLNNTRVIPARLLGFRLGLTSETAGRALLGQTRIEVLLIKQVEDRVWEALVKPGRKLRMGERVRFGQGELECTVTGRGPRGIRLVKFDFQGNFDSLLDQLGHVPLPPYIDRPDTEEDFKRYQTVFAKQRGAIAAPTAGLHFTPALLDRLREKRIETAEITLHVGPGTFQPVRTETVEDHQMEPEFFEVTAEAAGAIRRALSEKRRVVAVGTTVTRTLESLAIRQHGRVMATQGETDLFIYPGFKFRCVGGLLTNFHLPRSTLLMLASAFASRPLLQAAYQQAITQGYRFYSYGDCMLIL
ncbi:MAG: tRNA preQ1(34) S-adenosylmethionine ribosyltransferase-isomerase QueA [Terriglobia bacterium]